jgi:hypothetical protein
MNQSNTFCILPWIHLSSRPDGRMRICCTANASSVLDPDSSQKIGAGSIGVVKNDDGIPANFNHTTLDEAWNSSYMRNIRKIMMRGGKPASCMKCYKEEDSGYLSKRNWETEYWGKRYDIDAIVDETDKDGNIPVKIRYIDLRLGSKCQLACVMCTPHDSSGWVKEWNEIFPQIQNKKLKDNSQWINKGKIHGANYNWHKNNPRFWNELFDQIPNLYQLYFAGGESLIIDEHYELLEECIKRGYANKIVLRYNSNAVEWRSDLFDLWSKFKQVRFHYSIDAYGEQNDYIRYPSNWKNQEEVFWKLDQTPSNVIITIATTVMAINVPYIPEFVKWKIEQGFKKINLWPFGAGSIGTHFAYWPPHLNVKILPKHIKKWVTSKYEDEFYPWIEDNWDKFTGIKEFGITKEQFLSDEYGLPRFKAIINFMNSEDWSGRLSETKEYLQLIDKTRGLSFAKTFPDLVDLII